MLPKNEEEDDIWKSAPVKATGKISATQTVFGDDVSQNAFWASHVIAVYVNVNTCPSNSCDIYFYF